MPVRLAALAVLGVMGASQAAVAADSPKQDSWTSDGFAGLARHGIYVPMWFLDPNTPSREGDGRPTTSLSETVSSMLRVQVDENGQAKYCEVLMTNGPKDLAASFCSSTVETARFQPTGQSFNEVFWVHAHQNPTTGDLHLEMGPKVKPRVIKSRTRK